jgi:FAD/FMN-containing dehydrogenase
VSDLQDAIQQLKSSIAGEIALPGSPAYEQASAILITKGTPAVVVLPRQTEDIPKILSFARAAELTISERNGGHRNAGHSTNDGGIVIDTRHLNAVAVIDEQKRLVRVGAGATWEAVAKALQPRGWGISSGDTKTVGVAGLALAGGVGWMVRRDGLALDNVAAVEIVTADGTVLRASATENQDLFWAVRGGGGNFGIATSFEFIAHPVDHVYAGMVMYDLQDLRQLLLGWRDYMRTAPEELTTMFLVMPANPAFAGMPASAIIMICYAGGDEATAMQAIEPLLGLGKVINKDIQRKPYADVLEEAHMPEGIKVITNNAFIRELSDEIIDVICKNSGQILQIRSVGGAMNRIAPDATAFAHRDNEVLIVAPTFVAPDATGAAIDEALKPWQHIAAFSSGAYVSFFSEATAEALSAAYPPATLERLAQIKKQYDPENIFSRNYNIRPA